MHHHFTKTGSGRTRGKLKKVARVHLGEVRARSRELAALRTGQGAAAAQVRTYTKKTRPFLFPCWSFAGPYYTRCKQDRFTKTGSGQHTHRESAPKTRKRQTSSFLSFCFTARTTPPLARLQDGCVKNVFWRHSTANCIIIDHSSAFESGLVAPFLYAAG